MRNRLGVVATLVLSALIVGCSEASELRSPIAVSESDSSGIAVVTISGAVEDLPEWTLSSNPVTEVSGKAPPFLGRVGEVEILPDGRLLIEDDQTDELRIFDRSGRVSKLVGGSGDGPGEFQSLTELTLTRGDTAYTYDRRHYRISIFGPRGELVDAIFVGRERAGAGSLVLDAWATDSEHLILHSLGPLESAPRHGRPYRDQRDAILHSLDAGGRERRPPVRFTGGYSIEGPHGDAPGPFANEPFVSARAGRVLHGSALDYELTLRTPRLEPVRVIRWEGWRRPLGEQTVQAVRDTLELRYAELEDIRPELYEMLIGALFAPELLPDSLPALGSAFLDERGRIWVSRFRPTVYRWSQEDVWHVLDPTGRPLARLALPPHSRLTAVRGDRAALVMRDSLEVEHVRVFEIEGTGRGPDDGPGAASSLDSGSKPAS